jgi:spore coat polysaccharide biosynthesis protein SpsF
MTNTLAILQARMSSTRLPGKVLKLILNKPMLMRQIERIQRSSLIDELIVATSVEKSDDILADICIRNGIKVFRGSLDDVLDRFYQAAKLFNATNIVRLTGDCPLAEPSLIDYIIKSHIDTCADYTSNTIHPTYPDGLDVEVFSYSALKVAWGESNLKSQREHVTPYLYSHPEIFKLNSIEHDHNLSSLRWTVDSQADFDFVEEVYSKLYPTNNFFNMEDVFSLHNQNPLRNLNSNQIRNEGYLKSLAVDQIVGKSGGS